MSSARITTTTKSTLLYLFVFVFPYLATAGYFGSCVDPLKCGFMCCYEDEVCLNKGVCVGPSTVQDRLNKVLPPAQASSVFAEFSAHPSNVVNQYITLLTSLPAPKLGEFTADPYSSTTTSGKGSYTKPTCTPSGSATVCTEPNETKSATPTTSAEPSSTTLSSATSTTTSTTSPSHGSGSSAADNLHVGLRVVCAVVVAVVGGVAFMM